MGAYLKALLKLVDSQWVTPAMWRKIIQNADKETLLHLQNEAIPNWKAFRREDWMDPEVRDDLSLMVADRLNEIKQSSVLEHFFDIIF